MGKTSRLTINIEIRCRNDTQGMRDPNCRYWIYPRLCKKENQSIHAIQIQTYQDITFVQFTTKDRFDQLSLHFQYCLMYRGL